MFYKGYNVSLSINSLCRFILITHWLHKVIEDLEEVFEDGLYSLQLVIGE